jgi:hypothetical protein
MATQANGSTLGFEKDLRRAADALGPNQVAVAPSDLIQTFEGLADGLLKRGACQSAPGPHADGGLRRFAAKTDARRIANQGH